MKKILLLSDTHSFLDSKVLKYAKTVDELWHAGDIGDTKITDSLKKIKPLQAVYGNIDGNELRQEFPKDLVFYCEEVKVFITHIGGYPNKYAPKIIDQLKLHQPKLFICGHSHILKVIFDKSLNILHLNPGAAGKYGIHTKQTMLRFTIDKAEIKDLEVVEW
jgi:putative phosphoesterase